MAWEKWIPTIERNGESKLKQKLTTPASRDNDIKTDVVVTVTYDFVNLQLLAKVLNFRFIEYRISSNKHRASNKHRPLLSAASLGFHVEISTSL